MSDSTPIRQQYLEIKAQYPSAILFFRLGDFYETFDADAEITARVLDIVLTGRNVGKDQRVPMAGIPYHARDNYVSRLLAQGYHVAICEQMGDEPIKGLVPRKVVRVMTPGTLVEPNMLSAERNNFLASLVLQETPQAHSAGLAIVDITTGHFQVTELSASTAHQLQDTLRAELVRIAPAELVTPDDTPPALESSGTFRTPIAHWKAGDSFARQALLNHFGVSSLAGFGIEGKPMAIRAAGLILHYLNTAQPQALALLTSLSYYTTSGFMQLDTATRRNLELTETLRGGQKNGSLLGLLDCTQTPMGGRLLRQWVSQPLLEIPAIQTRLDGVQAAFADSLLRAEVRSALKPLGDLERLINRVLGGHASPADVGQIRAALQAIPTLQARFSPADSSELAHTARQLNSHPHLVKLLQAALIGEPPGALERPGFILPSFSPELEGVLAASKGAREWIANLEGIERERSGIRTLKVGFNKVFGYYIEVSRAKGEQVPSDYIRKQTLVNAERFITPELKEYETLVLNAEEQILAIEQRVFGELCQQIVSHRTSLLETARQLALLDVYLALGETAARHNFIRPQLVAQDHLEILDGRHPVVEERLPAGVRYTPNDCAFQPGERVWVITGPNMSGKSTLLRQVAIICLMAQIGSFVPARSATLGMVDRIFTRIGAQDEIHAGQSTFMVEMVETANILNNATAHSLLILDEIGRGTSTYDGLSLAWAIIEYIHNHPQLRAKTLFATHYHELTDLAELLPGVRNYNVAVSEDGEDVVFLHKIVAGGADRSYGIHVARLAGIPRPVLERAGELLRKLQESSGNMVVRPTAHQAQQMALFPETNPLLDELRQLDVNTLSPIEALNKLYDWQRRFGR